MSCDRYWNTLTTLWHSYEIRRQIKLSFWSLEIKKIFFGQHQIENANITITDVTDAMNNNHNIINISNPRWNSGIMWYALYRHNFTVERYDWNCLLWLEPTDIQAKLDPRISWKSPNTRSSLRSAALCARFCNKRMTQINHHLKFEFTTNGSNSLETLFKFNLGSVVQQSVQIYNDGCTISCIIDVVIFSDRFLHFFSLRSQIFLELQLVQPVNLTEKYFNFINCSYFCQLALSLYLRTHRTTFQVSIEVHLLGIFAPWSAPYCHPAVSWVQWIWRCPSIFCRTSVPCGIGPSHSCSTRRMYF